MGRLSAKGMRGMAWAYHLLQKIKRQQQGAATAEYALILALVVIALIGTLGSLRDELIAQIDDIISELNEVDMSG